ncbi:MAG: CDGSH iron-sulfur domain-containing protein [Candidatus Nanopusillus sp.]|jgi:CDGSH-type Zn-finger protein|nr:CDGSH iron-sulfur domain-containing protein [Candidatus Nanopusillus sp.]MCG2868806.1 CDGSH iron-sulfur domain-containing protein [Candidatus Nanopusillus sp.]MCG2883019.1 CDGSH iron-sulfur domain-containing protein [Candidatus Nanopusillus sp.]
MVEIVIKGYENGPYEISVNGEVLYHLCRCGYSQNKPYCDGSHRKVGFQAKSFELKINK